MINKLNFLLNQLKFNSNQDYRITESKYTETQIAELRNIPQLTKY